MKYVIVGNSAAAVGCVEGIRQQDAENRIVVISDEPYHTYSRPAISYLLFVIIAILTLVFLKISDRKEKNA